MRLKEAVAISIFNGRGATAEIFFEDGERLIATDITFSEVVELFSFTFGGERFSLDYLKYVKDALPLKGL